MENKKTYLSFFEYLEKHHNVARNISIQIDIKCTTTTTTYVSKKMFIFDLFYTIEYFLNKKISSKVTKNLLMSAIASLESTF